MSNIEREKTDHFSIDGNIYLIKNFPEDIRKNVDFFDKVRDDLNDAAYRYNVLLIATQALESSIIASMKKYINKSEQKVSDKTKDEG